MLGYALHFKSTIFSNKLCVAIRIDWNGVYTVQKLHKVKLEYIQHNLAYYKKLKSDIFNGDVCSGYTSGYYILVTNGICRCLNILFSTLFFCVLRSKCYNKKKKKPTNKSSYESRIQLRNIVYSIVSFVLFPFTPSFLCTYLSGTEK